MLELTFLQFLMAFCMGLGAVCIFVWAVLSGQFVDIEDVKYQVLEVESNE